MATASPTAAPPLTSVGLTEQVARFLAVVLDKCRGSVLFRIGRGTAAQVHGYPVERGFRRLPDWILRELSYRTPDDIQLSLVTVKGGATAEPLDAAGLWTEISLPATRGKGGVGVPLEALDAATARLGAFALPVSALIDGGWSLIPVWLFEAPVSVDRKAMLAGVQAAQRALAVAVGGRTDEIEEVQPRHGTRQLGEVVPTVTRAACDPLRAGVRLPGSRNHDSGGHGQVVSLAFADVEARYTLDEIEAACAAQNAETATKGGRRK